MTNAEKVLQKLEQKIIALLTRRRKMMLRIAGLPDSLLDADIYRKVIEVSRELAEVKTEKQSMQDQLTAKDEVINSLKERLAIAEARLNGVKLPTATSKNSSLPSSKNPIGVKHTNSLREKSNRKTGGQPGHAGTTHAPIEDIDVSDVKEVYPLFCPFCGAPIDKSKLTEKEIRFLIDFPTSLLPVVTKYIQLVGKCENCGKEVKGEFPATVTAPICYGPRVEALVAYLSTFQDIPFKRMTEMLDTLFGIPLSQGTISNMLQRMRKKSKIPMEVIRQMFMQSTVGGADESGLTIDGDGNWIWVFQTEVVTYLVVDPSRGERVLNMVFPEGLQNMMLVTDRWPSYFNLLVKDHQICIAHLLRNTFYFVQLLSEQPWPTELMELFRNAIEDKYKEGSSKELREKYDDKFDQLLQRAPKLDSEIYQEKLDTFVKGLQKHKSHVFTFLEYQDVPADNNASERAVRPIKTKMKVSGQFKSLEGAQAYASIHSIVQTARKNGQNPYLALAAVAENGGAADWK